MWPQCGRGHGYGGGGGGGKYHGCVHVKNTKDHKNGMRWQEKGEMKDDEPSGKGK